MKLNASDVIAILAFVLSFAAFITPYWLRRQRAKITEAIVVGIFQDCVFLYVTVYNHSALPLNIHGATFDEIRMYRHPHRFADRNGVLQNTTEFPKQIAPYSEDVLLMEFVNQDKAPFKRDTELLLKLNADRRPIKKCIIITQADEGIEQGLRET